MTAVALWVWVGSPDDRLDVMRYARATDADVLSHPTVQRALAEAEARANEFEAAWEKDVEPMACGHARHNLRCEGCGEYVKPDPVTPEGRGHQVPNDDGSPGFCGPISCEMCAIEARAREEEREGTRDILEDAEDVLGFHEMHGDNQPPAVTMHRDDYNRALVAVRRARSMEDKDHE